MKKQAFRVVALVSFILALAIAPAPAQDRAGAKRKIGKCVPVSGSMSTNFISQDTTLGTVTGDLRGAISATLLEFTPGENGRFIGRIQHQGLVTESGDKIFQAEALIDLTPVSEGVFYGLYRPIAIVGGTGKFDGITGTMTPYGVLDTNRGEVILRYRGEICAAK
ncbi:MAG: hypothetical protein M3R15_29715 [Acidobacteriota bacterium]|nr:hypothetical protein [Acidobacteriota bacterium]